MKNKKNYPSEVYLNGNWMPPQEATVSVFDRAFMFGDGIYEVTPFYRGKPFRLQDHLDRLKYCLGEIKIPFDFSILETLMFEVLSRAGLSDSDAAVYIQVSRGAAPRTHYFPDDPKPTFLMYAFPAQLEKFQEKRWKVLVSEDFRWQRCDIKSTALLANTMSNEEAIAGGFDENLLVRDGYFTEGSHSTAFFVSDGTVYTHPEGPHILSGITRKLVLEMCRDLGVAYKEEAFLLNNISEVQEIFLTGTTTQITVVESLHTEGKEIYTSQNGEITARLQEEFARLTRASQ
ncbi:aminotransferase class IV [Salinimicrobium xinjiangense]|uniref:aminotransferase class IV n=1 Tax=Salinimicrobium xinjiangense TaxID=438596 RepID=UPI00040F9FEB|nr:aminotransferase class IV [Salinimicrobium xinjiangense]